MNPASESFVVLLVLLLPTVPILIESRSLTLRA